MAQKYDIVRLPSFETDLARFHPREEGVRMFLNTLSESPLQLKNAHPLLTALSPLWAAHFLANNTLFIILYFVCSGVEAECFKHEARENGNPIFAESEEPLRHDCDRLRIFICRIGMHSIYELLDPHR
jgi:hypothetical protein